MTGQHQRTAIVRRLMANPDLIPVGRFRRLDSGRVECVLCRASGTSRSFVGQPGDDALDRMRRYRGGWVPWAQWQIRCLLDHGWLCSCGRAYPTYASLWRHIGGPRPVG